MNSFEDVLSVGVEDIELEFKAHSSLAWLDFLLNPRRLRGSDFLMRWSQGLWSEERIRQAVDETAEFFALPYGPSSTAPEDDVRAFELYFERLEAAGLGAIKRPDLLIFRKSDHEAILELIHNLGGVPELPFTAETEPQMQTLIKKAILAVESENSLWIAARMPDYGATMKPQKRLGGKLGLKKSAVLPTIILKEEDILPLHAWQIANMIPIHIWHIFFDQAYGIALDEAQRLITEEYIQPTEQIFQAPGGATTKKLIFKVYYSYGYTLGHAVEAPELKAKFIEDKNGHILPYVHFEGGKMTLSKEAVEVLQELAP